MGKDSKWWAKGLGQKFYLGDVQKLRLHRGGEWGSIRGSIVQTIQA